MTTCLTFPSQLMAQESARTERHELPNAERSAKQLTDKMQHELGLTDKHPDMKGPHPAGNQELEKLREKNEKKLKKILTEEQYAKWKKIQPQKPPKDFSRK